LTTYDIFKWLAQINAQSALPGICYFLFFSRKWKGTVFWLFILLAISWLGDNIIILKLKTDNPNTHPVSQTWAIFNYIIQGILLMKLFPNLKNMITGLIVGFVLSCVISFGWFYSFEESNTPMYFYAIGTSIFLCILCFYYVMKGQLIQEPLKLSPVFLYLSATFLYNCIVLLFFLTLNYLAFQKKLTIEMVPLQILNVLANTAKNITFFYVLALIDKGRYFGRLT